MGLFDDIKGRVMQERMQGIEDAAREEARVELEREVEARLGALNEAQGRYQEAKAELDALSAPEVTEEPVVEGVPAEELLG